MCIFGSHHKKLDNASVYAIQAKRTNAEHRLLFIIIASHITYIFRLINQLYKKAIIGILLVYVIRKFITYTCTV